MDNIEFKKQGNYYDGGYSNSDISSRGIPDLKIVDYVSDIANKKIINIGGGNSADVWFLASQNQVYAIDSSPVGVEQAKAHGIIAAIGDVSAPLPFFAGMFDAVILKDILEHIYNPIDLLLEAKRILKNNGYIIVSLPNHFYLPFRLRILFGGNLIWKSLLHNHKNDFDEWNYMHIRFFTWKGVKKMFKKAGLYVDKGYWDFGAIAHYSDPLALENAFKINNKKIETKHQWLMYKIMLPLYKIFNFIFPPFLRSKIVALSPGLLCAGFYLRVKKSL